MAHYPYYYLVYSLLFLAALSIILVKRKDLRRPALCLAAVGAVLNPVSELLYFRDYWRPDSLLGTGRVSVEDVIFGASMYGLAFALYPFLTGKRLDKAPARLSGRQLGRAGGYIAAVGALTVLGNVGFGINSVIATGAACILVSSALYVRRRDLILPGIASGLASIAVVSLGYALGLDVIAPHLLQSWWLLWGTPLGITYLGNVPVTELAWFFGISNFFSIVYLKATGRRYVAARNPSPWQLHLSQSAPKPISNYIYREQGVD